MRLNFEFVRLVSRRFRFTSKETGETILCDLEVSHPGPGERLWGCGVRLWPIEAEWRPIYGVDGFQALQLSFQYIDHILDYYRLLYDVEDEFEEP